MFRDSFWYPDDPKSVALIAVILLMVILHQSELVGLYSNASLMFDWLPAQLAYDIMYTFVGFLILVVMYVLAPEPPEDIEPTRGEGMTDPEVEPEGDA